MKFSERMDDKHLALYFDNYLSTYRLFQFLEAKYIYAFGTRRINGIYHSHVRSKKWPMRMIFHAVDLALVNSWFEYKQQALALGIQKKRTFLRGILENRLYPEK